MSGMELGMTEKLGKKSDVSGLDNLKTLTFDKDSRGRPAKMPELNRGEVIICGLDDGLGEVLYACYTLEGMKDCAEMYLCGNMRVINWYVGNLDAAAA